jgi:hypothetical protein
MTMFLSRANLQDGPNMRRRPAPWALVSTATLVVAALTSAACMCWGQSAAQTPEASLADAARASRQESAHKRRKAPKVVTNDDIPSRAAERLYTVQQSAPPTGATAPPEAPAPLHSSAETSVPGSLQPSTVEQARTRVQTLKEEEKNLARRYDQIQSQLGSTDDPGLRRVYSESLAKRDATLARKRKEIEDAAAALKAMEATSGRGDTNHGAQ